MVRKLLIITAAIVTTVAATYTVKQQADIQKTNRALAEIELALAKNQTQQMEAQNLMLMYQMKSTQLYQRIDSVWDSVFAGGKSPWEGNLETRTLYPQAKEYSDKAEEQAERLYRLQVEHESLLKRKLELLKK